MGPAPTEAAGALAQLFEAALGALGSNAPAAALTAALLESLIGLGVVFPGGTVVILAGFAARSAGAAGFVEVAAAAWLGMMLGTTVDYWLGRAAGSRLVPHRAPWRLAYRWQRLLRASHAFMARWGWWAIAVANLAGPGRSSIAVAAGASRWSFGAFLVGQALAAAGWSLLYCGLGYSAAAEARRLESVAGGFGLAVVALFLAVVAGPWLASLVLRLVVRWLRPRLRADSPAGPRSLSPAAVEPPPAPPLPGG